MYDILTKNRKEAMQSVLCLLQCPQVHSALGHTIPKSYTWPLSLAIAVSISNMKALKTFVPWYNCLSPTLHISHVQPWHCVVDDGETCITLEHIHTGSAGKLIHARPPLTKEEWEVIATFFSTCSSKWILPRHIV